MSNDNQVICLHCFKTIPPSNPPKRDFLGFAKVVCPNCKLESNYPLSAAYYLLYLVLLVGNTCYLFYVLSQGSRFTLHPFGLVVFVLIAIALAKNSRLKREIEAVKKVPPEMQSIDFRTYKRTMIAKDPAYASMSDRDLQPGYQNWLATQQSKVEPDESPKLRA